jgi:tetratricopeptide (TPR) repeat protein
MTNATKRNEVGQHPIFRKESCGYFVGPIFSESKITAGLFVAAARGRFRFLAAVLGLGWFAASSHGMPEDKLAEEMVLTPQSGAAGEDVEVRRWQERARADRATAADFERLGWAFVAKARRTLDGAYYTLAEKTAEVSEAHFGVSAESRLLRGHVWHNQHRFREAETLARGLAQERGAPEDWALLSDVLMEQGNLTEAVDALQRMVNLKPGVDASSRIAQLRWLKGDLRGATVAMEEAACAASPRDAEAAAWTLTRLAGFYLQAGRVDAARNAVDAALNHAPDFPPALLARGKVLLVAGESSLAVAPLRRAAELNPLPEYQWWLADALRAAGHNDEALAAERAIKARGAASDPRTLALFLATRHDDATAAVRLAREELTIRGDVLTHDALAWALAAKGDFAAAEIESRAALAEHTADARIYFHAGEIAAARGQREAAEKFFAQARPWAAALTPSERAALDRCVAAPAAVARAVSLNLSSDHHHPES